MEKILSYLLSIFSESLGTPKYNRFNCKKYHTFVHKGGTEEPESSGDFPLDYWSPNSRLRRGWLQEPGSYNIAIIFLAEQGGRRVQEVRREFRI